MLRKYVVRGKSKTDVNNRTLNIAVWLVHWLLLWHLANATLV